MTRLYRSRRRGVYFSQTLSARTARHLSLSLSPLYLSPHTAAAASIQSVTAEVCGRISSKWSVQLLFPSMNQHKREERWWFPLVIKKENHTSRPLEGAQAMPAHSSTLCCVFEEEEGCRWWWRWWSLLMHTSCVKWQSMPRFQLLYCCNLITFNKERTTTFL